MLDGKDPEERPQLHIVDIASGPGEMSYVIEFDTVVSTGVKDIILPIENVNHGIYTLTGIKVAAKADAESFRRLPDGIYIINRRKVWKR